MRREVAVLVAALAGGGPPPGGEGRGPRQRPGKHPPPPLPPALRFLRRRLPVRSRVRVRRRRGLPLIPRAGRARLGGPGRPAAPRRVDRRGGGALNSRLGSLGRLWGLGGVGGGFSEPPQPP